MRPSLKDEARNTFRDLAAFSESRIKVPLWRELRMWRLFRPQMSPVMPVQINGALGELLTLASFPDLAPLSREELEEMRHWGMYQVNKYLNADASGDAIVALYEIWRDESEFCLYLRDFALGGVLVDGRSMSVVSTMHDLKIQRALASAVDGLPIVALSNFVDPLPIGPLVHLYARPDRWREVVGPLVDAAAVIVVSVGDTSAGVAEELEMIRQRDRRERTLLISDHDEPGLPADFPHRLQWDGEDVEARLAPVIGRLREVGRERRTFGTLAVDEPLPPPRFRRRCAIYRKRWIARSERFLARGRFRFADVEDALTGAYTMACWEKSHLARAEVLWRLGVMQMIHATVEHLPPSVLGPFGYGISNMSDAITIVELVIDRRPDALNVLHQADMLLEKFSEHERIDELAGRVARLRARVV